MRIQQVPFAGIMVLFGMMSLSLTGCGPVGKDFTPDEFKKVIKGLPEAKATEILGGPIETLNIPGGGKRLSYRSGDKYYSVSYTKEATVEEPMGPMNKKDYDENQALFRMMIQMLKK